MITFYILIIFLLISSLVRSEELYWYLTDFIDIEEEFGMNRDISYLAIDCYDSVNCAAAGNLGYTDPLIRVTTNGGKDWQNEKQWHTAFVDLKDLKAKYYPPTIADIAYPDSSLCIATADSGYYYISRDKCKTWVKRKLQGENMPGKDKKFPAYYIYMYNSKFGGITAYKDIYLTSDGGESWKRVIINLPDSVKPSAMVDIYIPEPGIVIGLGYRIGGDFIIKSTDWGDTWEAYPTIKERIAQMSFVNQQLGWGAGWRSDTISEIYHDIIQHTTDGGRTWHIQLDTIVPKFKYSGLRKISFSDSLNGIALGEGYKIWKTYDGGKNWIYEPIDHNIMIVPLQNFCFIDHANIYAVTLYNGQIHKYGRYPFNTIIEDNAINQSNELQIRPNPASEYIEILHPSEGFKPSEGSEIRIYNTLGKCVLSESIHPMTWSHRMNIEHLPAGVYYVRIGDLTGMFVKM